ncbi:MAG: hypothetical protein A2X25_02765 [Chloroflexi bacterium GWB2_49_20]|nr:MAG: hypothetical protein A2X25_02765 [Chloroflexi bacterium GWB2_49_20]OGN78772.1 MAG: hypothetical protein A2X26_13015 [Chloroflexi bacterium GWC2_49_37]OGN85858.1 MAG: hypothetical protein A2X27_11670 [Chloroflexi bacterium GWD2_49_16]
MPRSLGAILRAFKSAVTYRAGRELGLTSIWQRNYHEHILRDQTEHDRIAKYIASNPLIGRMTTKTRTHYHPCRRRCDACVDGLNAYDSIKA